MVAVDIIPERAKALKEAYDMEAWYEDYREAIGRADIDIVDVCAPTYVHEGDRRSGRRGRETCSVRKADELACARGQTHAGGGRSGRSAVDDRLVPSF